MRILKQEVAEKWLKENLPHIEIMEWGGKGSAKSSFYNKKYDRQFHMSFNKLKVRALKEGADVGAGTGQLQPLRYKSGDVEKWLQENRPEISLVKWGGGVLRKSTFYNNSLDKEFEMSFATLRGNKNVKNPGLGKDKRPNPLVQSQLDSLSTRYEILKYDPYNKSLYYDKEREIEFEYFHSSLVSMLNRDREFVAYDPVSSLERFVQSFLDLLGVSYVVSSQVENGYKPDFLLPDHKLIIECDGLYWHSDAMNKDKNYHSNKREAYLKIGYRSLFFREDEIVNSPEIVKSIIRNALGFTEKKIGARSCIVDSISPDFFSDNHLMGKGAGKCFGLIKDGEIVTGMQVKWISKKDKSLEVSRFCHAPNTTTVGGFSKLIKYVENLYSPAKIVTYIDLRYGTGTYLEDLGFRYEGSHLSFKWVKGQKSFHRMRFPGNTGYDNGCYKIWDCGQAKWVKYV